MGCDAAALAVKSVLIQLLAVVLWISPSLAQEGKQVLTLESAYRSTLQTHEGIKIAEQEIAKSKLLPNKALSVMLPQVYGTAGYTELSENMDRTFSYDPPSPSPPVTFDYETIPKDRLEGELGVVQPFFRANFFPLRRQAFDMVDRSIEAYYQTAQGTLFQVAQAYYEVLKTDELVQHAHTMLDLTEEELAVARSRYAAGAVTQDVVLRSELDVTIAQSRIIENSNQLTIAKDALKSLIGMKTSEEIDLATPPETTIKAEEYEALVQKAFESRPDYRMALYDHEVAKSGVDVAKARFYPRLQGSWAYTAVNHPTNYQDDNYWTAAVTVQLPIFEGGMQQWDLQESRITLQQAGLAIDGLQKTIPVEVEDALLTVKTSESLLENVEKQVELASKNYDIVFAKFRYGAATSVELSEARTMLDGANVDRITDHYDYQVHLLALQQATGLFARDYVVRTHKDPLLQELHHE